MIEIVQAEVVDSPVGAIWSTWLEIEQGGESWMLPATAPGELAEAELQAHLDAQEAELWRVAQEKAYPVDLWANVPLKRLLKAFALVVLDEINVLRVEAGLAERTPAQIITAIKGKL